jgi:hypothetical protein
MQLLVRQCPPTAAAVLLQLLLHLNLAVRHRVCLRLQGSKEMVGFACWLIAAAERLSGTCKAKGAQAAADGLEYNGMQRNHIRNAAIATLQQAVIFPHNGAGDVQYCL